MMNDICGLSFVPFTVVNTTMLSDNYVAIPDISSKPCTDMADMWDYHTW